MSNYNCTNCKCEEERRIIKIELAKLSPFQSDLVITNQPGVSLLEAMEMINEVYFNGEKFTKEDIKEHNISYKVNGEIVGLDFKLKEDSFIEPIDCRRIKDDDSDKITTKVCNNDMADNNIGEVEFNKADKVTLLDVFQKHMELTNQPGVSLSKAMEMINEVYFNDEQFTEKDIKDGDSDKIVIKVWNNGMAGNNIDEVEFNKEDEITVLDVFQKHMELAMGDADNKEDMRKKFNNLRVRFEFDDEEVDLDYELTRSGELKAKSDISINELLLQQISEMLGL